MYDTWDNLKAEESGWTQKTITMSLVTLPEQHQKCGTAMSAGFWVMPAENERTAKTAKLTQLIRWTIFSLSFVLARSAPATTADTVRRKNATKDPTQTGINGCEECCPIMAIW